MAGGVVLTPKVASKVMKTMSKQLMSVATQSQSIDELTLREIEVIELLHAGMRDQGIAEHLAISAQRRVSRGTDRGETQRDQPNRGDPYHH
jgi:DNA-binding NarL/FixJ family response regulator